jgi:hypothetical protein
MSFRNSSLDGLSRDNLSFILKFQEVTKRPMQSFHQNEKLLPANRANFMLKKLGEALLSSQGNDIRQIKFYYIKN